MKHINAAQANKPARVKLNDVQHDALVQSDPIPQWVAEWKQLTASINESGDSYECHQDRMQELEEKICSTRPTTSAGAAAQLEYAMDDFGDYMMGNVWKNHDRKLFNNLLAALKGEAGSDMFGGAVA